MLFNGKEVLITDEFRVTLNEPNVLSDLPITDQSTYSGVNYFNYS